MGKGAKGKKAAKKAKKLAEELTAVQADVADGADAVDDSGGPAARLADMLAVGDTFTLAATGTRETPGFEGGKAAGRAALAAGADELSTLQEKLFAEGRSGGSRSLLLVVQGMDTSGKGGIVRHVVGAVDPQGVAHTSFGAPTAEERSHDFLWRIRRALPEPGHLGVFDRSHYEDVLVARVEELVRPATWRRRYDAINRLERTLVGRGTRVLKVMLHISPAEQAERLAERLDRPDKHWKYDPGDVDARLRWDDYQAAYADVLERCSTDEAPWHVVPADRKWYARWAVQQLLLDELRDMDLRWPTADFDVDVERERLLATT